MGYWGQSPICISTKNTTFLQLRCAKYFLLLRGLHCSSTGIFMACIKKNIFLCKTKPSILPAHSKWMTKAPCGSRCSSESSGAVLSEDWSATMRNKPFMIFNGIFQRDFKKEGGKGHKQWQMTLSLQKFISVISGDFPCAPKQ